jgi:hypothetical protein
MIAVMHLPEKPVIEYMTPREKLLDQAVQFALRGMGLSDAVIQRHYQPSEFAEFLGLEAAKNAESG